MKRTHLVAVAITSALLLLLASSLIASASKDPPLNAFVRLSKRELVGVGDTLQLIIYVANTAPIPREKEPTRDLYPNNFVVTSIDVQWFINGALHETWVFTVDLSVTREEPTATYTTISSPPLFAGRWDPIVLPGEINGVLYYGWLVGANEPSGTYTLKFAIHGTFNQVKTVDLIAFTQFKVTVSS